MYAQGGKVCNLIEQVIAASPLIPVEFEFSNVAASIVGTDIAYISESSCDPHVCIAHLPLRTSLWYQVQWYCIQEIFPVGTFKEPKLHTPWLTAPWAPSHHCYHVRSAKVESYPCV